MTDKKPKGRPPHQDILTPAEWRVVHLAQHGMSNQQIANNLDVSINAIKYHISNVVGKLQTIKGSGVTNKKSLLAFLGAPKDSPFNQSQILDSNMNKSTINSVGQIARSVKDIQKTVQWYRDTLGLKHLYTFGQLAFFDIDGVRLMLSEAENKQSAVTDESIIYFKTKDINSSHLQLTGSGVEFTHAPHKVHTHDDGTEEWMAFFTDLEGRPLGLMGQYK